MYVDLSGLSKGNCDRKTLKELGEKGLLYKAKNPVSRNPAVTRTYRQDIIKRIWDQYGTTNTQLLVFWIYSQIGILVHNKYVRKLEIWR